VRVGPLVWGGARRARVRWRGRLERGDESEKRATVGVMMVPYQYQEYERRRTEMDDGCWVEWRLELEEERVEWNGWVAFS